MRPRPKSVKADPVKQAEFVQTVRPLLTAPATDIWFADESGIASDPRPYLIWAKRGTKPILPVLAEHWRTSIVGAVRPSDGYFCALSISGGNQWTFQVFLDELNRHIDPAKRNLLIMDNARFHHASALKWGKLEPLFLPPYSPELNPIEELWLQMKKNFFYYWLPTDQENLERRAMEALNYYLDHSRIVKSITATTGYL